MRRFFIDNKAISDKKVMITGELMHHMSHVLRLSAGEHITVCTGDGHAYEVVLNQFAKEQIEGQIVGTIVMAEETAVAVTLWQGLPKGDKLEMIIQKCTELGVSRIIPVMTSRSVVKLDESKAGKKVDRWQKIALRMKEKLAKLQ